MYEAFCTGHQEATEVIRRVQHQHPPEWDEFERRCSDLVHEMSPRPSAEEPQATPRKAPPHATSASAATPTNADTFTAELPSPSPRKRSRSVHSLDGAVRSLRRRSVAQQREALPFPNELRARRLTLMDYLIKPIQRICKYPLLLDQLKPSRGTQRLSAGQPSRRSAVHVAVESAAQAMRHVAAAVDAARARQAVCAQSALIVSRVASALRLSSSSSASQHSLPASLNMTSSFLSSLGTCLLAGSLDVVHHSPLQPMTAFANIKAKYLGAFLYLGGYLILVKVCKGKVYEPKHWFSLADFEIVDLDERDGTCPCSWLH